MDMDRAALAQKRQGWEDLAPRCGGARGVCQVAGGNQAVRHPLQGRRRGLGLRTASAVAARSAVCRSSRPRIRAHERAPSPKGAHGIARQPTGSAAAQLRGPGHVGVPAGNAIPPQQGNWSFTDPHHRWGFQHVSWRDRGRWN